MKVFEPVHHGRGRRLFARFGLVILLVVGSAAAQWPSVGRGPQAEAASVAQIDVNPKAAMAFAKLSDGDPVEFYLCPCGGSPMLMTYSLSPSVPQPLFSSEPSYNDPGIFGPSGGGVATMRALVAGTNVSGFPEVFTVTSDGGAVMHTYTTAYQAVGSTALTSNRYTTVQSPIWTPFTSLGVPAGGVRGNVDIGRNSLGHEELYVTDRSGAIFHNFATPGIGTGWSGWDSLGTPPTGTGGDIHVGTNNLGNQELYVLDAQHKPWHMFATPGAGSGWSGWSPMSSVPSSTLISSDITVGINYAGNQELYVRGTDGNIYHSFATPGIGDGWSGFWSMGHPEGAYLDITLGVTIVPRDYRTLGSQSMFVWTSSTTGFYESQTPGSGTGWTGWTSWTVL